jgi:ectoine hydroxylase-related dioxygenase (phytanoyl-CoA dioxygenase family)
MTTMTQAIPRHTLTDDQVDFFWEHGYLHIPEVFSQDETDTLSDDMNRLMAEWAVDDAAWTGDWRKAYMDEETEKKSKLIAMHDLWFYSDAFMKAVTHPKLIRAMADLLGPNVELHHSTMHVKPPQTGHPFPMHQDDPFYKHSDNRYVDTLIHLDDTCHENGEIRFLDGSFKQGRLDHVVTTSEGETCTPHLPVDNFKLADTVPVPAKRGDVVCFNIYEIHGSYINTTDKDRRLVRVGYRNPENRQIEGQSHGRPGMMVAGFRDRQPGDALFSTNIA